MTIYDAGDMNNSDVSERKPVRLSLHLIVKRHLPPNATSWSQEQIIDALTKITRVRLDRENIGYVDSLDLLSNNVTNIYLQKNCIEKMSNFDCLQNIQFLTLACNRIRTIENISHLKKLIFLDLSSNNIADFDEDELPQSLVMLNLSDNPCTQFEGYRIRLIQKLPNLKQLDNEDIPHEENEEDESNVSNEESTSEDEETDDVKKDESTSPEKSAKLLSCEILLRSQNRVEDLLKMHKQHSRQLNRYKKKLQQSNK